MAILSFADNETEQFFVEGIVPKKAGWFTVKEIVRRKLDMLEYAIDLKDLRSPPGNRLEALSGKFAGWFSVRVNDQWRIVFQWLGRNTGPTSVSVCDYH